ncbi:hypothetical protein B0H10DRAFT_2445374 [Mycena sp. CBHHK59/15]|nr:hypothetical protein B0H10DRAFT_2445374 [Mycena sp. CBHHK59/15]
MPDAVSSAPTSSESAPPGITVTPNLGAEPTARRSGRKRKEREELKDLLESLKESNRKKVMEATSSGSFWKEVKKLADPKPGPISVTAASLKDVFEKRLNLPEVLPKQFDSPQHSINKILSNLLPAETEDHTPEGFFTEK